MDSKHCPKCDCIKSLDQFYIDKVGKSVGKVYPYCKVCECEKQRAMRQARPKHHKIKDRKKLLKRDYNLTLDEFDQMLIKQDYRCKICKRHESELSKALCVDHCHITGKVRGLLCLTCNTGLGSFRDSIEGLEAAIYYLKESL